MQIQLTKKTESTETINLEVPAYFKTEFRWHKITEDAVYNLNDSLCFITRKNDFGGMEAEIQKALQGEKIDAGQFQDALNVFLDNLNS